MRVDCESLPWELIVRVYHESWLWEFNMRVDCKSLPWELIVRVYHESWLWEFTMRVDCESLPWELIVRVYHESWLWEFTMRVDCKSLPWELTVRVYHESWLWECHRNSQEGIWLPNEYLHCSHRSSIQWNPMNIISKYIMSPKKTLNIISLKKHMNKKSLKVLSKFSQSLLSQGSLPNSLPYPSHTRAQLFLLSQRSVCLRAYSYILQIWTHPKVQVL